MFFIILTLVYKPVCSKIVRFLAYFLQILGSNNKEVNSKDVNSEKVDSKVVYNKDIGSKKASSEKVGEFLVDFALFLLLLFTKSYKKRFNIYFLKSY